MIYRSLIGAIASSAALMLSSVGVLASDAQFPDLKGAWSRIGEPIWDTSKPQFDQQPPLTPEYKAIFNASLADMAAGGQGDDPTYTCLAPGMPRSMIVYHPMEIVVTPDTTHILIDQIHDSRRIYTDGRDWPDQIEPSFAGYSIGRWIDQDGDGRYDELVVETRGFKGPRVYDRTGIPLHKDNQTIVRERMSLDKTDRNYLLDEITVIDHALTRPWTVTKRYHHDPNPRPNWVESVCAENNNHVEIEKQGYMLSADGYLMPTKRNQPPPDLRYFKQIPK